VHNVGVACVGVWQSLRQSWSVVILYGCMQCRRCDNVSLFQQWKSCMSARDTVGQAASKMRASNPLAWLDKGCECYRWRNQSDHDELCLCPVRWFRPAVSSSSSSSTPRCATCARSLSTSSVSTLTFSVAFA